MKETSVSQDNHSQDFTQWSLPDSAIARLGKGSISGDIAFSPDGSRLAVSGSIGIWIYDAYTGAEDASDPQDDLGKGVNLEFRRVTPRWIHDCAVSSDDGHPFGYGMHILVNIGKRSQEMWTEFTALPSARMEARCQWELGLCHPLVECYHRRAQANP